MAEAVLAQEQLFALRNVIAKIEAAPVALAHKRAVAASGFGGVAGNGNVDPGPRLAFQHPALDAALGGGLQLSGLNELRTAQMRDAGAASGFALALCVLSLGLPVMQARAASRVLWIGDTVSGIEAGLPHAAGLKNFGLEPGRLLFACPKKLDEALFMAEAALAVSAFAAVILEVRGNPARFGLTESRRLHLRARAAGRPLLLLRQSGEEEASSAMARLLLQPLPARPRLLSDGAPLDGSIGNPAFHIRLEKSRNPAPLDVFMEWNANERQFFPVEPVLAGSSETAAHSGFELPASVDRPDRPKAMGSVLAFSRAS